MCKIRQEFESLLSPIHRKQERERLTDWIEFKVAEMRKQLPFFLFCPPHLRGLRALIFCKPPAQTQPTKQIKQWSNPESLAWPVAGSANFLLMMFEPLSEASHKPADTPRLTWGSAVFYVCYKLSWFYRTENWVSVCAEVTGWARWAAALIIIIIKRVCANEQVGFGTNEN